MADNVAVTPGSGATVAFDDISGIMYQRVKIGVGADGSATDVSSAAPLPVYTNVASSLSHNNVAVTSTATLIKASTASRKELFVKAIDGTVYVGSSSAVTTSTGYPLYTGEELPPSLYTGDVYGITASGTVNVRYWEAT